MKLEQFLDARFLGNVKVSPNKSRFAFLASHAEIKNNAYNHTLYIGHENKTKKMRKLGKNNGYVFLSESKILIDLQSVKEEEKALEEEAKKSFYYLDVDTNKLTKAFTLPFRASLVERVNEHVVLLSGQMSEEEHILYTGTEEQRKEYLQTEKKQKLYEDIEELPYYFNGQGFIANTYKQLFLYDIKEDRIKPIFKKDFHLEDSVLSIDGTSLYYTGKTKENVRSFTSKIYVYDLLNDSHETVYNKTDYSINKLVLLKDKLVVAASDMTEYGLNQNSDFYRVEDGEMTLLADFKEALGNTIGTDMRLLGSKQFLVLDDILYFVTTINDHSEICTLNLDGELRYVYQMPGSIDGLFEVQGQVYVLGMKEQKLQEIYTLDLKEGKLEMLTRLNSYVLTNTYVAKPKKVVVKKKNHTVLGYVLLPKDYDKNQTYPAILDIHGGPKTVYGKIYYHEMQYWANLGYIVFFANPRGSDGKGNEFADIRGKYGTIDYADLMDFTKKVLKKYPAIDQNNLFVTGGSYGGYMTNWMVGQTDIFKAAVTQRSISNWLSFYGTSDIGYYFASDQTDGHPLEDMDKLYEQSPIKYAMNMKTPLLFIHSDMDLRCPMEQAQQLYAILKTNGVDTKLVWFKDETHELSRGGKPQARIKRLSDITDWFEKYRN